MKLYVGNLSFQTTEGALEELFAQFGTVTEAMLVMDKMTQRPRGFGFVTMGTAEEAQKAIEALNGKNVDGRNLIVNEARGMPLLLVQSLGSRGKSERRLQLVADLDTHLTSRATNGAESRFFAASIEVLHFHLHDVHHLLS